jgi:hypothetical protein
MTNFSPLLPRGPLFGWWAEGRVAIQVEDVFLWLGELVERGEVPPWTPTTRRKVARGLLAALRDFGVLKGAVHKEFARSSLSLAGFAYVEPMSAFWMNSTLVMSIYSMGGQRG